MKESEIIAKLSEQRDAARQFRSISSKKKNAVLKKAAQLLLARQDEILKANQLDLAALDRANKSKEKDKKPKDKKKSGSPAFRDRLTLNPKRISQMVESLKQVVMLSDPVGEIVEENRLKNGLRLKRLRSPLGVIFMIFESRPNVAIEAFSLAFKAGNGIILRGGRESGKTVNALYGILTDALASEGIPKSLLWGITDTNREIVSFLLKQKKWIDVVVPRGGDSLIEFVVEESRIPIIKNDRGICHVYVHKDADQAMAAKIIVNAKTQRPGVCNSLETVLIHEAVASKFLPFIYASMDSFGVRWNLCPKSYSLLSKSRLQSGALSRKGEGKLKIQKATNKSWDTEYLDLEINCRIIKSVEEAITHIETHSSKHSDAIITASPKTAAKFQQEIDSAVVYWNASTRFTDGFEFGLGGELGISTQKLHVRGPVGLRELTSTRWVVDGQGQTRE
ncbi:MAG: glutamate-5-semialdehyde dehydrogenase [Bdellovibrionia bacterium]